MTPVVWAGHLAELLEPAPSVGVRVRGVSGYFASSLDVLRPLVNNVTVWYTSCVIVTPLFSFDWLAGWYMQPRQLYIACGSADQKCGLDTREARLAPGSAE